MTPTLFHWQYLLRYLSFEVLAHEAAHLFCRQVLAHEIHQLCECCLNGGVLAADDTGLEQLKAGLVTFHVYASAGALCDVDDYLAFGGSTLECIDEPRLLWCISCSECAEYHTPEFLCLQHAFYDFLLYAREQGEDDDVAVVLVVCLELEPGNVILYVACVELYVCSCLCQCGVVVGAKGAEALGVDFGCAVTAHELLLEEDTNLGHYWCTVGALGGGNLYGGDEVLLAVGAQCSNGQLAAGEDDGLHKVLEHEAERRCGEGHGVGTMEYHKTVVAVIILLDDGDDAAPECGLHVR